MHAEISRNKDMMQATHSQIGQTKSYIFEKMVKQMLESGQDSIGVFRAFL